MLNYKYLIIGGGMTADAAVRGIRELDPDGSIGLVSRESNPPYNRPPLTKGLWKGKPIDKIWRNTESLGVDLHLNCKIESIDPDARLAKDEPGTIYAYEKLLLATGGSPRKLPFGEGEIIYFRTLEDYQHLQALTQQNEVFAVIGGGFIGSEIAAALIMHKKKVIEVFPEKNIGGKVFPPDLGQFVNDFYRQKGGTILPETTVTGLGMHNGQVRVKIRNLHAEIEQEISVDSIVAGIGIQPNVELALAAGLKVNNGIVVDETLHTSHPDIFAAGDVAEFYNPALDKRMRVEHEDNANTMGQHAGRGMAGGSEPYFHLPYFYSDLFELGYEAVGELDAQMETFSDWIESYRKGVVYYLREGRVRGVLLWDIWGQVDAARRLIADPGPFKPEDLVKRLPEKK